MGAHFPAVELDNTIRFSTLSRISGFLWHSSKWVRRFGRFLQYTSGIEVLACSLDTNLDYNSVSVHHRNIQVLATELYKIVNWLSPEIIKGFFPFSENTSYNTRNNRNFHSRALKSVAFGSETLSPLAPKISELVKVEIKNVESVASFKIAIKKWKPIICPCCLCRTYVFQVGFV